MTRLYVSGSAISNWVENTKSPKSVEFAFWKEVEKIYSGSRVVLI